MRYVLDRDVALRSWERIPWACYRWGDPIPRRLERNAFELLALCDGEPDLEPSPLLGKLVSANMAHPAAPGETWDAWSAPCSYGNRLFHSLNWAVTGRCNYSSPRWAPMHKPRRGVQPRRGPVVETIA